MYAMSVASASSWWMTTERGRSANTWPSLSCVQCAKVVIEASDTKQVPRGAIKGVFIGFYADASVEFRSHSLSYSPDGQTEKPVLCIRHSGKPVKWNVDGDSEGRVLYNRALRLKTAPYW